MISTKSSTGEMTDSHAETLMTFERLMHTKFPLNVMVLGVVSNEEDKHAFSLLSDGSIILTKRRCWSGF